MKQPAPWLWVSLTRVVCSSLKPLDSAKARQPLPPSPHLTLLGHDPSFTGFYNATHFKQRGVNKFIKSCILSCSFIPANLIDMIIMEKRENKSERGKVKISALGLNLSSQISASYFMNSILRISFIYLPYFRQTAFPQQYQIS